MEDHRASRWGVGLQVGQFALAGAIALVIVGVATSIAARRVGEREAIADARLTTLTKAKGFVEPSLSDGLVGGDTTARATIGGVVARDVLDRTLVRVKIWRRDGTILYSDEPHLVGERYDLGADEVQAIDTGRIEADVTDLDKPENRYEQPFRQLLEVYLPVTAPGGESLLFEAYYRYDVVRSSGTRLWQSFAPIALGALVALELVQIPLAYSLASRLRQRQREREGLLHRALEASEVERRQIAGDLHDGVVQDLAGAAWALSALARSTNEPSTDAAAVEAAAETVRDAIKALRSLVVEIYPPDLDDLGLAPAIADLVAKRSGSELTVDLDADSLVDPVGPEAARLVYRAAQEGLRNVAKHAAATHATIRVATAGDGVSVVVSDDGTGFDPAAAPEAGHVGLVSLRGLVADAGGTVEVRSTPGSGTELDVLVPNR